MARPRKTGLEWIRVIPSEIDSSEMALLAAQHGAEVYYVYLRTRMRLYASGAEFPLKTDTDYRIHARLCRVSSRRLRSILEGMQKASFFEISEENLHHPEIKKELEFIDRERAKWRRIRENNKIITGETTRVITGVITGDKPTSDLIFSSSPLKKDSKKRKEAPPALIQRGEKHIRMTESEWGKLEAKFGAKFVAEQIENQDLWIEYEATGDKRRYKRENHDHFLFCKGWLERELSRRESFNSGNPRSFNGQSEKGHLRPERRLLNPSRKAQPEPVSDVLPGLLRALSGPPAKKEG